jgi:hypothetical protein
MTDKEKLKKIDGLLKEALAVCEGDEGDDAYDEEDSEGDSSKDSSDEEYSEGDKSKGKSDKVSLAIAFMKPKKGK